MSAQDKLRALARKLNKLNRDSIIGQANTKPPAPQPSLPAALPMPLGTPVKEQNK
jgi:hypothetical protein